MMAFLVRPVMKISSSAPALIASITAYWISGLSTMGSISFGLALVAGRKRVPRPATGKTALRIRTPGFSRIFQWLGSGLPGQFTGQMGLFRICAQQSKTDALCSRPVLEQHVAGQEHGLLEGDRQAYSALGC